MQTRGSGGASGAVTKLYIGNLTYRMTDQDLQELISPHATVVSARVATDRESGRSRGFGFVEVVAGQAPAVITALDGTVLDGRALTVNEARPREDRPGGRPDRFASNDRAASSDRYAGGDRSGARGGGRDDRGEGSYQSGGGRW